MARVVLFDVLGTLVQDPFYDVVPAFFGLDFAALLAVKHPTHWFDFEHGLIDEQTFLEGFFTDGRPFDHQGFMTAIEDAYAWLPGMEALLEDVVLPLTPSRTTRPGIGGSRRDSVCPASWTGPL